MSPTVSTFLIEIVNFLLLAAGLGWVLFRPVGLAIDRQRAAADEEAAALAARKTEQDRAEAELNRRRAALDAEIDEARTARLHEAEREANAVLEQARQQAARELSVARQRLDAAAQDHAQEVAAAAAEAGANAVRRLLDQLGGPDLDRALLGAACHELEQMAPRPLASVAVESARPLSADDRARVASAAGIAPDAIACRVAPELLAGVRVTTGSGLVDASAAGLADYARQALDQALQRAAEEG